MAKKSNATPASAVNVARMMPVGGEAAMAPSPHDLSYLDKAVIPAPEATVGVPVSEGNPDPESLQATEQPEANQETAQPPAGQPETGGQPPAPNATSTDPRFAGKTLEDVMSMYKNLEAEVGRHRNEVGDYRRFFDEYVKGQMKPPTPQAKPVDDAELLSRLLTKPSEVISEIRNSMKAEFQAERNAELVTQIKTQNASLLTDPNFINWIRSNVPPQTVQRLDHDPSELMFALNTYKQLTAASHPPANAQTSPTPPAQPRNIQVGVAAGTGTPTKTPPKTWSRREILNMITNDPAKYKESYAEIERAYAEGRVKQ